MFRMFSVIWHTIRSAIALVSIKLAKRTCIYGFCHDYLVEAERTEKNSMCNHIIHWIDSFTEPYDVSKGRKNRYGK